VYVCKLSIADTEREMEAEMDSQDRSGGLTEERKREIEKEIQDIISKGVLDTLSDKEISQWENGEDYLKTIKILKEKHPHSSETFNYQKLTREEVLECVRLRNIIYPVEEKKVREIIASATKLPLEGRKEMLRKAYIDIENTYEGKKFEKVQEKAILKDEEIQRHIFNRLRQMTKLTFFLRDKGYKEDEVAYAFKIWIKDYLPALIRRQKESYQKRVKELEAEIERLTKAEYKKSEVAEILTRQKGYETERDLEIISRELGLSVNKYKALKKTPPTARDFYSEDINLLQIPVAYHGKMATPKTKYIQGNYIVFRDTIRARNGACYLIEIKVGSPDGYLTSYDEDLLRGICLFTEYEEESKQYISRFSRWEMAKKLGWKMRGGADSERMHKGLEKIGLIGIKHNRFYKGETEMPATIETTFFKKVHITNKEDKDRDNFFIWNEPFATNFLKKYYKNLRLRVLLSLSSPTSRKLFECLEGAFGKRKRQYSIKWRKLCPKLSIFDEDTWSAKATLIKACEECKKQEVISEYWFSGDNNELINFSRKHKDKEGYEKEDARKIDDERLKKALDGLCKKYNMTYERAKAFIDKHSIKRAEELLEKTL